MEEILNDYINSHPDYWEFEEEIKEIERLKALIILES